MDKPVKILIVEDNDADVELLRRELTRQGVRFESRVVRSADELRAALSERAPDVVCSDYTLPGFDGNAALRICRELRPETPFLFVSGSIGETRAVETLKSGATDYILKDAMGRLPAAITRALRDVAQRAEQRLLEDQLRQAQKMEAIGRLAGGVAHDFNNMLTAISGYAEMLAPTFPEEDPRRADVDEILKTVARATALTRHMLAFSRRQVIAPRALDVNGVIEGVAKMLLRVIGEDIAFTTELAPPFGMVLIDPGQLEQILLNLAVNARDAMPRGGALTITTRRRGGEALIAVRDDGCGMSDEVKARLFEPFFTTKETGTGLGLSTVNGIVKRFGGRMEVESAPGHGTTFLVALPIAQGVAAPAPAPPRRGGPTRGTETILLAEDDPALRILARRVLAERGYAVLDAPGSTEALALFAARPEGVDILVTDVVMPGLPGPELARRLRAQAPGLRVLFLSGYIDERLDIAALSPSELSFLQKPFTPQELAARVRDVLDSPPGPLLGDGG